MFDRDAFFEMLQGKETDESRFETALQTVRDQLEEARDGFYDLRGDGTLWHFNGTYRGCGYADGVLELREDGLVQARIDMGMTAEPPLRGYVEKLFCHYNERFKTPGLKVDENGGLWFESEWLDPVSEVDADVVAGRGVSTIHAYASLLLALRAGVDPWKLLDLGISDFGGGDDGGEGLERMLSDDDDESMFSRLRSLLGGHDDDDDDERDDEPEVLAHELPEWRPLSA